MTQNVGRLGVVLGLDTAEFVSGVEKAQKTLKNFVSNTIPNMATAGAVAFSAMTYKALSFADSISDVAKANEIATSTILQLSEALAQNGGEAENVGKLLSAFTSKIDEAAQGGKAAQYAFSRIGIELQDIKKLSNEDLFGKTLDKLSQVEDPIQRNALAVQVFGKAIKGVDIKGLADDMGHVREEFIKYAQAVETAGDLHDKLDAKATKTMILFTNAFIPTLNKLFDELNKTGGATETMFSAGGEAFKSFVYGVRVLVTLVQTLNAAVNLTALSFKAITTGNISKVPDLLKEYNEYVASLREGDREFAKSLGGADAVIAGFQKAQKELIKLYETDQITKEAFEERMRNLGQEYVKALKTYAGITEKAKVKGERPGVDSDQLAIDNAKLLSYEYASQGLIKYQQLQRQAELVKLTNNERQIAEAIYKIEDEGKNKILEIDKKIAEEENKRGTSAYSKGLIEQLKKEKDQIILVTDALKTMTKEEMIAQQEAQRTFEFGWNKAFDQYVEDATNSAKLAQDVFSSLTNNMSNAIDQFVRTGKLSFKDFAKSVIQDLIAIQLKSQAMKLFSGLGGGLGDIFGSIFSSGPAEVPMPTFASGGSIVGNNASIVGENGPELFIPNTSGTIVPNNQLSSAIGGTTINYNGAYIENMSAIDTQSASQFLAKNKDAVWAANQSANRSMPVSR